MHFSLVFRALTITAFIASAPRVGTSQSHFLLEDPAQVYRLDHHVQVLIDSTNALTIDDVAQPDFSRLFKTNDDNLTFGFQDATIWLRVATHTASPDMEWYLDIPAPFLEQVDFFQRDDPETWRHAVSGYFRKHHERPVSHTGHLLPLVFGSDATNTTYVRISGISPKTFALFAIERENFVQRVRQQDMQYGIFFGILLVMCLYNLYLWMTLRQSTYFLYVLIIALTGMILATISGYTGKFLWPEMPMLNYVFGKLAIIVVIICLSLYTMRFLEVKKYSRVMYYLLLSLIPLAGLALLLSATGAMTSAGNHLITLATIIFIAAGIGVRLRGNKTGTYFVASWAPYFSGGLLLSLRNSGVFHYNFLTTHFVEIGAMLGVTLMGFSLGAQYRRLKKEKEEAQKLTYQMQKENAARLETMVEQRTDQLSRANTELQRMLEKNRAQTQIIENKNAELDSFFHRVSHDLKGPVLSSLGLMALAKLHVKDEVALEYIDRQHAQLARLSQIINGLSDLTKLTNHELRKERIDFDTIIDDCIVSFDHSPNFPRVRFEKHVSKSLEFFSEWTLINAILQNLIENAIKYARQDEPYVKITVLDEAGHLVVRVEDNGEGISEEHQAKVFEMFYRVSTSTEGSGLGLYILKRSVDRLNGVVEVRSDPGVGSTFTVRLPMQPQEQELSD